MKEIWKEINGYDGLYQVSNLGRVKNSKGLIMAQKPSKRDGYVRIQLFKNGKYKAEYVHILVAKAFVPKPLGENLEINHIDANKSNNIVSNLEWVTRSQNTKHAIDNNLRFVNPSKGKYGKNNPNSKPVAQCDLNGNIIKIWDSREEAAKHFHTRRGNICNCVNGRKKSLYGYTWKNVDTI